MITMGEQTHPKILIHLPIVIVGICQLIVSVVCDALPERHELGETFLRQRIAERFDLNLAFLRLEVIVLEGVEDLVCGAAENVVGLRANAVRDEPEEQLVGTLCLACLWSIPLPEACVVLQETSTDGSLQRGFLLLCFATRSLFLHT